MHCKLQEKLHRVTGPLVFVRIKCSFVNFQCRMRLSLLYSIFHVDIQFWRSRKSLEGLSVRSVFFNVFQSVIVLLYVWDNEANTIVIISCFVGLIIEIWKIHKVVDVTVSLLSRNCFECNLVEFNLRISLSQVVFSLFPCRLTERIPY